MSTTAAPRNTNVARTKRARKRWAWGIAVLVTALAALLEGALRALFGSSLPFVALYPAAAVVAILCGTGPGILAMLLASIVGMSSFVLRHGEARAMPVMPFLATALFGAGTAVVILAADRLRRIERQELGKLHRTLKDTLENMSDGFVAFDRGWRFLYLNPAAAHIMGTTPNALLGRVVWEAFPEAAHTPVYEQLHRCMDENVPATFEDRSHLSGRWYQHRCHPTPYGLALYFDDVTEHRASDAALRESEQRLRIAEERVKLAAAATRFDWFDYLPQTGELIWSEQAKRNFGLPADATVDYSVFLRTLHPEEVERVQRTVEAALRGDTSGEYAIEYRTIGPDGIERWLAVRGKVFFDDEGRALRLVGGGVDITELKTIQKDLERAKAQAERANRAKDEFLAVLSHELKTPLTPVLASVVMLERKAGPEIREMAHRIRRNVELEARIIDDLLDMTRIVRGKLELSLSPADLRKILDRAVQTCHQEIEARRLLFSMDRDPSPLPVDADEARLEQVFLNLLRNAVKFTPAGGHVRVSCRRAGDAAAVVVSDDGAGIEPAALERVFDAFVQEDSSVKRAFGGLGLGLAISKALVSAHNGTINAESEGKGKGATVTVTIPLHAGI
jgi:PAS domain S-box-containing protein